jgi:hypothetical protein
VVFVLHPVKIYIASKSASQMKPKTTRVGMNLGHINKENTEKEGLII